MGTQLERRVAPALSTVIHHTDDSTGLRQVQTVTQRRRYYSPYDRTSHLGSWSDGPGCTQFLQNVEVTMENPSTAMSHVQSAVLVLQMSTQSLSQGNPPASTTLQSLLARTNRLLVRTDKSLSKIL